MDSKYKLLFEKELNYQISSFKVYYDKDDFVLADVNETLYLWNGKLAYKITSNPYEPCTYLQNGNVFLVIHNAFEVDSIRYVAIHGGTVESITGNKYDIDRICHFLAFASKHCLSSDIGYVEGKIAIEKMKELGALSPETAIDLKILGIRSISSAFTHSKKLTERVMITEDEKVYVRIKHK